MKEFFFFVGSQGRIIKSPGNCIRGGTSSTCKCVNKGLRHFSGTPVHMEEIRKIWVELEGSGCSEQVGVEVKIKTWSQIADSFVEYIQEFDFILCKKNLLSQGIIYVLCSYQNCVIFFSFQTFYSSLCFAWMWMRK